MQGIEAIPPLQPLLVIGFSVLIFVHSLLRFRDLVPERDSRDIPGPASAFTTSLNYWGGAVVYGTAFVLALLIHVTGTTGLAHGVHLGLLTGVGFIAAAMASDYALCGWKLSLFYIQAGYRVTYTVIMGGVLAIWQ